jgi:hypothetical protein
MYGFVAPYYDDHGIVQTRHETKPFTEAELNALNDCGDVKRQAPARGARAPKHRHIYGYGATRCFSCGYDKNYKKLNETDYMKRWYQRGGGR